jgi:cbb3-type cytochrome oxidase maturation protein
MESLYLLIPVALVLVVVIVAGFLWAVRSGQFDDLEGPAWSILMDDDDGPRPPGERKSADAGDDTPEDRAAEQSTTPRQ